MTTSASIVEINNISKYYKTVKAVENISFAIEEGDIFAFLGPNGAGKTTTLRILLDIIKPDRGTIRWNLNGMPAPLADPTQIGYLPEERGLYPDLPILRTLVYLASIRGMNPEKARKAALEWLERLELHNRANEKLQVLSKGNQQKVQFVAAILHKPRFAILDEPFSGLDPIKQEQFIGFIQELNQQGTTILLSAHQMQLVEKIAQKVLLINKGQEVYYGPLKNIYQSARRSQTFEITLSDSLPPDHWSKYAEVINVRDDGSGSFSITFAEGITTSQVLALLSHTPNIESIRSHSSNLHDIFLNMLTKENQ